MATPRDITEVFAGAGQRPILAGGRFVRVLAADASGVTIIPDTGQPLLRFAGQDIDVGPGGFRRLQISVTVASTVKLVISDTRQADNQTSINATVSATVSPGGTFPTGGDVACPNAASTQLIAGNANELTVMVRSSAANTYAAGTVRVGGTGVGAASGIELNPGEVITISTTAPIAAYNGSGAAVTLQVLPVQK